MVVLAGNHTSMVLPSLSVLGVAALSGAIVAELSVLVAIAVSVLVLVALANTVMVFRRFLEDLRA